MQFIGLNLRFDLLFFTKNYYYFKYQLCYELACKGLNVKKAHQLVT